MMQAACSKTVLAFAVLLASPALGRAQPLFAHADSIESTVTNADLVFIAKLIELDDGGPTDGQDVHRATIVIERVLKKDILANEPYERFQVPIPRPVSILADWMQRSSRLLVACDTCEPNATTVIELVPGNMQVLRADFTLLRDPKDVIRAAEETLRRTARGVKRVHTFGLQVPRSSIVGTQWDKYYSTGGYLVLKVPVDKQLEERAIQYLSSEDSRTREVGLQVLRYFESEESIARIREQLGD